MEVADGMREKTAMSPEANDEGLRLSTPMSWFNVTFDCRTLHIELSEVRRVLKHGDVT